jgi:hypothetical protein
LAVVFASRVAHHLHAQHFVQEVFRVGRPGGQLLLGRITREPESLPGRLQRYKRTLLTEHGLRTGAGDQAIEQIVETCCLQGATPLPTLTAARWTRTASAGQLIAAWQEKPQLNSRVEGHALDANQRAVIVQALTDWARHEFGDLDRPYAFTQAYTLRSVRLPLDS